MIVENRENFLVKICFLLIILLVFLSIYNALIIGLSWDEGFHHINGLVRFNYLTSLGDFKNYNYLNNQYYPGLYDTIAYAISHFVETINKQFFNKYLSEIKHLINLFFSLLSLLGLFLLVRIFFNKSISVLSVFFTLLNPFFFGHMSMNPKDIIIFFSLIWFCYFFWKYLNDKNNLYLNLFASIFFAGFGCGTRLSFVAVLCPVFIIGVIYFFKKTNDYFASFKIFFIHLILSIFLIIFFTVIAWPHILANPFQLVFDTIKNSINWNDGPKLILIDGIFHETKNTSLSYFFDMIKFKFPFFLTFLYFSSYFIILFNKNYFNQIISNFFIKFLIVNILILFPIVLSIIFSVILYDYLRLVIFIIPFMSILVSLSFYYFLKNFYSSFYSKISLGIVFLLFILFFYRYIALNPYQYTYVNYYYSRLPNSLFKFEHDYWGTSIKELALKIKKNYSTEEINNFKISYCGANFYTVAYYLKTYLNITKIYRDADHILMTNRASFDPNKKTTCFSSFEGEDIVTVTKNGLMLSTLRKIKN